MNDETTHRFPDAWRRGVIDAAFVWGPALASIKETGKVLITSGQLSSWGKATFDGFVVRPRFAEANPAFIDLRRLDQEAGQAGSATQRQQEQTGGGGVESSTVPDPLLAKNAAHAVDHVV